MIRMNAMESIPMSNFLYLYEKEEWWTGLVSCLLFKAMDLHLAVNDTIYKICEHRT